MALDKQEWDEQQASKFNPRGKTIKMGGKASKAAFGISPRLTLSG
jgi:hypothetical protein